MDGSEFVGERVGLVVGGGTTGMPHGPTTGAEIVQSCAGRARRLTAPAWFSRRRPDALLVMTTSMGAAQLAVGAMVGVRVVDGAPSADGVTGRLMLTLILALSQKQPKVERGALRLSPAGSSVARPPLAAKCALPSQNCCVQFKIFNFVFSAAVRSTQLRTPVWFSKRDWRAQVRPHVD